MRVKQDIRGVFQRFGIDVVRYPLASPLARTAKLLRCHGIDCVVDVGANDGGFASSIRSLGYDGKIVSFEPLEGPYSALSRKATADRNWQTVRCAIGDDEGEVTINVSGNAGLSSSILPMLQRHVQAEPHSRYVAAETAPQRRLDKLLPEIGIGPENRVFLKIDVQGYESAVLDGAKQMFSDSAIIGLQLELSIVPLYRGAMSYREALNKAEGLGMTLMGLDPVFADPETGQLLQVDAVFFLAQ